MSRSLTEDEIIQHKTASAKVVRLEDALIEAMGHGWINGQDDTRHTAIVIELREQLTVAEARRVDSQDRLFGGVPVRI